MKFRKDSILKLFAAVVVLLCILTLPQTAQAASESDLSFTLNETQDGYIVSGCNRYAIGDLVIPATYNGLPVTAIGRLAFAGYSHLTSITIPDSVTSIGSDAFRHCAGLTEMTISDSITSIGPYAFYNCRIKKLIIAKVLKKLRPLWLVVQALLKKL